MSLKLRPGEKEKIKAMASAAEMSVNGYIRAKSLGTELIEKPTGALKDNLHRLYVELAAQGNNINQITRNVNRGLLPAESGLLQACQMSRRMGELMDMLQWTLAGRRPPDDY